MSETVHPGDRSDPGIVGYDPCRRVGCRNIVLTIVAHRTSGLCEECIATGHLKTFREPTFIVGGQRHGFAGRGRAHTAAERELDRVRYRRNRRAARRAMVRLKNLMPEHYDLILAEERAREGLDPMPIERAVTESADDVDCWERLIGAAS